MASFSSIPEEDHIRVLLSVEYHGCNYGGFQRQALHNKINFPSIQGTLEQAATVVCHNHAPRLPVDLVQLRPPGDEPINSPTEPQALLVMSSGRTDRAVHSLQHMCLLRLPFSIHHENIKLHDFLSTNQPNSFLQALNQQLPHDIHVYSCQILSRQEQRQLRFPRKQYTYLIHQQQPPTINSNNSEHPRHPWPPWQDYTCYVHHPLDIPKMQRALALMVGTHDFGPLSCETSKTQTIRTIEQASLTVSSTDDHDNNDLPCFRQATRISQEDDQECSLFAPPHYGRRGYEAQHKQLQQQQQQEEEQQNTDQHDKREAKRRRTKLKGHTKAAKKGQMDRLDPSTYHIIQINLQGNGFLRHQVRRMVSVLLKIGHGQWEPEIVTHILEREPDFIKKQSVALAPGRALWKRRVWIDLPNRTNTKTTATNNSNDGGPREKPGQQAGDNYSDNARTSEAKK